MSTDKYILDKNGNPVQVNDIMDWARWFEDACRDGSLHVAHEYLLFKKIRVSTVFLGLDHNYGDGPYPIIWETMVFVNGSEESCKRCGGNREQAEAMHESEKERVINGHWFLRLQRRLGII